MITTFQSRIARSSNLMPIDFAPCLTRRHLSNPHACPDLISLEMPDFLDLHHRPTALPSSSCGRYQLWRCFTDRSYDGGSLMSNFFQTASHGILDCSVARSVEQGERIFLIPLRLLPVLFLYQDSHFPCFPLERNASVLESQYAIGNFRYP